MIETNINTLDNGLAAFLTMRPRLRAIAHRILGNSAEAEDVVQDVWLRWQRADQRAVRDAAAFLATTATRLAINVKQSARARRQTALGTWLSEPVDPRSDARQVVERGQALASGLEMLVEKLTPTERAAYILREAFDYTYRHIASVLGLEEANARQVVTRARQHVAERRTLPASSNEQKRLVTAFLAAASTGNVAALEVALCRTRELAVAAAPIVESSLVQPFN